jgi:NAD(P)-dependent dehydrogenase (short-subunit alcohol dehydrogenase family)
MDINGRNAIVTGGAGGIGRATVMRLAERGADRIKVVDIDETGLAETARLAASDNTAIETHVLDLSDLEGVERWFGSHAADCDILFNNAGIVSGKRQFPDIDIATLRRISDINLNAVVLATQIAAQSMQPRGGGVIIQTVSTVALGSGFYDALYAATKTGLMMFLRCCAGLQDEMGVRVVGVLPGLVDTGILRTTGGDDYAPWMHTILANNPACQPDDIAAAVIDLIEDDGRAGGDWVAVRLIDGRIEREWGHAALA